MGISEAETKDTIEKINKVSNCLLEKLIKLIAPARTIEKNRETQIINISNKRRCITIGSKMFKGKRVGETLDS